MIQELLLFKKEVKMVNKKIILFLWVLVFSIYGLHAQTLNNLSYEVHGGLLTTQTKMKNIIQNVHSVEELSYSSRYTTGIRVLWSDTTYNVFGLNYNFFGDYSYYSLGISGDCFLGNADYYGDFTEIYEQTKAKINYSFLSSGIVFKPINTFTIFEILPTFGVSIGYCINKIIEKEINLKNSEYEYSTITESEQVFSDDIYNLTPFNINLEAGISKDYETKVSDSLSLYFTPSIYSKLDVVGWINNRNYSPFSINIGVTCRLEYKQLPRVGKHIVYYEPYRFKSGAIGDSITINNPYIINFTNVSKILATIPVIQYKENELSPSYYNSLSSFDEGKSYNIDNIDVGEQEEFNKELINIIGSYLRAHKSETINITGYYSIKENSIIVRRRINELCSYMRKIFNVAPSQIKLKDIKKLISSDAKPYFDIETEEIDLFGPLELPTCQRSEIETDTILMTKIYSTDNPEQINEWSFALAQTNFGSKNIIESENIFQKSGMTNLPEQLYLDLYNYTSSIKPTYSFDIRVKYQTNKGKKDTITSIPVKSLISNTTACEYIFPISILNGGRSFQSYSSYIDEIVSVKNGVKILCEESKYQEIETFLISKGVQEISFYTNSGVKNLGEFSFVVMFNKKG